MKKRALFTVIGKVLAVMVFLLAVGIVQYFIWSDLLVQEFDADVAENVIWAQAALDAGSLINPDFVYTHLLPFGGQLIFIPIVKHFGVGMQALRLGLCICSILFSLALTGFFFSLGWKFEGSFFAAGAVILLLSGTKGLRSIFWAHVVHYNLSLFYLLLSFIFLGLVLKQNKKHRTAGLAGLMICLTLGSANNTVVVLFFSVSLLSGLLLESFLRGGFRELLTKSNRELFACVIIGTAAGLILGKVIASGANTAYVDQYSVIVPPENWSANLARFPKNWIGMFGSLPEQNVPVISSVGIKLLIRMAAAILILALTVRSFFAFGGIRSRSERVFLCVHWIISAEILFFFIFGLISNNDWRIMPMFFTSLITALIVIRSDLRPDQSAGPDHALQLLDIGAAVFTALYAIICSVSIFRQSISTDLWFGQGTILKTLADHSLNYGYNLDYWFGNSITVLTDERIRVREVILRDGKLSPSYHQSNIRWYEDQPEAEQYFLVCQEDEYWLHPEFADGASAVYRASQERTYSEGPAGFFIFVYPENIF